MFTELLPLLQKRRITITLAHLRDGIIRANVIPMRIEGEGDDTLALSTPLSLEGTAQELDARLATDIQGFVASTLQTGSTLEQVKAAHQAALKAIDAEHRKELATRKNRGGKLASSPTPETASDAAGDATSAAAPSAPPGPATSPLPLFESSRG